MGNSCTSNPCPEDYQCRSTLDWQGFACDCNKTVSGNCDACAAIFAFQIGNEMQIKKMKMKMDHVMP